MRKKILLGVALIIAINLAVFVIAQNSKTKNEDPSTEAACCAASSEVTSCAASSEVSYEVPASAETDEEQSCCVANGGTPSVEMSESCCAENSECPMSTGAECCQVEKIIAEKKAEAKMKK